MVTFINDGNEKDYVNNLELIVHASYFQCNERGTNFDTILVYRFQQPNVKYFTIPRRKQQFIVVLIQKKTYIRSLYPHVDNSQ